MSEIKDLYQDASRKITVPPEVLERTARAMEEAQNEAVSASREDPGKILAWYRKPAMVRRIAAVAACLLVFIIGFGVSRLGQKKSAEAPESQEYAYDKDADAAGEVKPAEQENTEEKGRQETMTAPQEEKATAEEMKKQETATENAAEGTTSAAEATTAAEEDASSQPSGEGGAEGDLLTEKEALELLFAGKALGNYDSKLLTKEDIQSIEMLYMEGDGEPYYRIVAKPNAAMLEADSTLPDTLEYIVFARIEEDE